MVEHNNENAPIGTPREGYDSLAERANGGLEGMESPWGDCPFQNHYSWPATRSLFSDVNDKRVLDAGCGIGDHVEWVLDSGATIVGVDTSGRAVEIARKRFGDRATFHQANLTEPLDFAASDTFDLVFSHLVFGHIEDWKPVFEEFHRVLSAHGTLVLTTIHPLYHLEHEAATNYYRKEPITVSWPDAPVTAYRRPFGEMVNSFSTAGFHIETLSEPKPQNDYEEHVPERYEKAIERPEICCIRARAIPSE